MAKTISELEAEKERLIARQKRLETRISGAKSKQASTIQKKREEFLCLYGHYRLCLNSFHEVKKNRESEEREFVSFKGFLWQHFGVRNIEDEKKREKATKKVDEILKLYKTLFDNMSESYSRMIQDPKHKRFGPLNFK